MQSRLITHPLVWIFFLGLFFRLFQLSTLPTGFHVDEAKIGWNAYSLWLTGRDDWLHAFPLHYDTFGDQRPTGFFYATVPSLALFGLSDFAIRFTPAIFGALGVVGIFFFVFLITHNSRLSAYPAFMLAISPWHISLSRAASEGIIATTLVIFGLVFLLKYQKKQTLIHFFISASLLLISYFFYHTSRILVPLFVLTLIAHKAWLNTRHNINLGAVVVLLLTLSLTLAFAITPEARGRLSQVSVLSDQDIKVELDRLAFEEGENRILLTRALHNKVVLYGSRFFTEYVQYLSGKFFLTPYEAKPARYQTVDRGLLLYTEFVLVAAGLVAIAQRRFPLLPLLLLLLSPLPAALTIEDAPNLHRSLFMSPLISILAGFGLYFVGRQNRGLMLVSLICIFLDFFHYTHMYSVHNPGRDSFTISRNTGTSELVSVINSLYPQYSSIYLTNRPDNLYPWFAFQSHQDPRIFNQLLSGKKSQNFTYGKLVFSQYKCPSGIIKDNRLENTLAVDTEGCPIVDGMVKIGEVRRTSGGFPFTFWVWDSPKTTAKI